MSLIPLTPSELAAAHGARHRHAQRLGPVVAGWPVREVAWLSWRDEPHVGPDPLHPGSGDVRPAVLVGDVAHYRRLAAAGDEARREVRAGLADVIAWLEHPAARWRRGACPMPGHPEGLRRSAHDEFWQGRRCPVCVAAWSDAPGGWLAVTVGGAAGTYRRAVTWGLVERAAWPGDVLTRALNAARVELAGMQRRAPGAAPDRDAVIRAAVAAEAVR